MIRVFTKSKIIYYEQANSKLTHLHKFTIISFIKKLEFKFRNYIFSGLWITPLHDEGTFLPKNCYYLPFVIENKSFKKKINQIPRILIVGKFQKRKNHLLAIKLLKDLVITKKIIVEIIGEVSSHEHKEQYQKVKNYLLKNNMNKLIKININLDFQKMENKYLKKNIFLLSSYNEPASISLLEAISYGLPSICHITCGTKTYVKNEYNGFILNNFQNELINTINKIIKNRKLLKNMSNNCLKSHYKNFSEETYIKNLNVINKRINN